jgi:hypothetical protein
MALEPSRLLSVLTSMLNDARAHGQDVTTEAYPSAGLAETPAMLMTHTNTEPMVVAAISSSLTMVASDAYWQGGTGHPRTTGTFSRVLGCYVREPALFR